jgi:hypothetical protein
MSRIAGWKGAAALLALLVVAPLATAAPLPPGKTALSLVPEKTSFLVYLHGVERTRDRFLTTLKAALPDQEPLVEKQLDAWLKDGIAGRKLEGLEKDGPVFLAVLELPKSFDKPPKAAVIVAVKDYAKFRDGLLDPDQQKTLKKGADGIEEVALPFGEEKVYFLDRKGWAIVTADKETIETFTKDFKGLDQRMSKDQAAKLLDGDLGLYVSMDAFNKEYAEQIKMVKDLFNDQLIPQIEKLGALDKATVKVYKTLGENAFQAVEDSQGILLTFDFRPVGFAVHLQTELRPNSPASKSLKDFKTSPAAELGRLPAGQTSYTNMSTPPVLLEGLAPFLLNVQGDPASEQDNKEIKAAIDKVLKAGPINRVDASTWPLAGLQVTSYTDAAKALEGYLDLYRAVPETGCFQMVSLKEKPKIKLKAEKYQNIDFHQIDVALDSEKTIERAFAQQPLGDDVKKAMAAAWKKRYGETVKLWVGTDGKVVVQVIAADWKSAQKTLDTYFGRDGMLANDPAFKELVKELPAEATLYGALDPLLYGLAQADEFRIGLEGGAMGLIQLPPNFPARPKKLEASYFGMALTLKPERASIDLFLSAKAIQECYKAFGTPFFN